jgi:hypothetical protein
MCPVLIFSPPLSLGCASLSTRRRALHAEVRSPADASHRAGFEITATFRLGLAARRAACTLTVAMHALGKGVAWLLLLLLLLSAVQIPSQLLDAHRQHAGHCGLCSHALLERLASSLLSRNISQDLISCRRIHFVGFREAFELSA